MRVEWDFRCISFPPPKVYCLHHQRLFRLSFHWCASWTSFLDGESSSCFSWFIRREVFSSRLTTCTLFWPETMNVTVISFCRGWSLSFVTCLCPWVSLFFWFHHNNFPGILYLVVVNKPLSSEWLVITRNCHCLLCHLWQRGCRVPDNLCFFFSWLLCTMNECNSWINCEKKEMRRRVWATELFVFFVWWWSMIRKKEERNSQNKGSRAFQSCLSYAFVITTCIREDNTRE